MKKYEELAKNIVKHVGGEQNVISLAHCITRLRFKLKDESKADTDILKNMDGVVTVIQSAGQYQVVIGNEVADVYDTMLEVSGIQGNAPQSGEDESDKNLSLIDRFIDLISGIFTPVLSVLIATGMIKGFSALLTSTGIVAAKGGTNFGIASTVAGIVQTILWDERRIVPVSTLLDGEYGEHDVFLGVPTELRANGVNEIVELDLSEDERAKLHHSAELVREHCEGLL